MYFFVDCRPCNWASEPLLRITEAITHFHQGFSNTMKTCSCMEMKTDVMLNKSPVIGKQ